MFVLFNIFIKHIKIVIINERYIQLNAFVMFELKSYNVNKHSICTVAYNNKFSNFYFYLILYSKYEYKSYVIYK